MRLLILYSLAWPSLWSEMTMRYMYRTIISGSVFDLSDLEWGLEWNLIQQSNSKNGYQHPIRNIGEGSPYLVVQYRRKGKEPRLPFYLWGNTVRYSIKSQVWRFLIKPCVISFYLLTPSSQDDVGWQDNWFPSGRIVPVPDADRIFCYALFTCGAFVDSSPTYGGEFLYPKNVPWLTNCRIAFLISSSGPLRLGRHTSRQQIQFISLPPVYTVAYLLFQCKAPWLVSLESLVIAATHLISSAKSPKVY